MSIKSEGVDSYYISKVEELEVALKSKAVNIRRLEAQRNELNAKGRSHLNFPSNIADSHCFHACASSSLQFVSYVKSYNFYMNQVRMLVKL